MSEQHTQGHMKPGVSLVGGVEHFTVVPHGSEQTVVAMCGLVGAKDEPESIANTRRIAASLNALEDEDTSMLEAIVREGTTVRKRHNEATTRLLVQREMLRGALELMLERCPEPPEPNCSCHLSPPCNDCVDHAGEREAFEFARHQLAKLEAAL